MEGRGEICFFDEEEEDTEICLFLGVEEGWKEGRRRDQWRVVKSKDIAVRYNSKIL